MVIKNPSYMLTCIFTNKCCCVYRNSNIVSISLLSQEMDTGTTATPLVCWSLQVA